MSGLPAQAGALSPWLWPLTLHIQLHGCERRGLGSFPVVINGIPTSQSITEHFLILTGLPK